MILHNMYNHLKLNEKDIHCEAGELFDWSNSFYKNEYSYEVTDDGIKMDVTTLFEIMFRAGHEDEASIVLLIELLTPLFREIPGAVRIIKICLAIAKGTTRDELLKHTFSLVRLTIINIIRELKDMVGTQAFVTGLGPEKLKERIDSFKMTPQMIKTMSACITACLMFLNKISIDTDTKALTAAVDNMCECLYDYQEEINEGKDKGIQIITDIDDQAEFFKFIMGVCKGEFMLAENIAQKLGSFDHVKIRDLINIFNRYKELIFNAGVYGLPQMTYSADQINVAEEMAQKAQNYISSATISQGHRQAGQVSETMLDAVGVPSRNLNKVANTLSEATATGPIQMIFGAVFKRFDKDNSGFLDYNEF